MPDLFENTLHSTLIPTKVASEISGYNADYLARLCREEKIQGTQVGRSWLINRASLEVFVKAQEEKKVERAESLRLEREKEYRRAQKPIMRAAFGDAVIEKTATTRSTLSSSRSHQRSTYSQSLVAAAIALMVVTGVAYASTNATVIGTLASIPQAAVDLAFATSPTLISNGSFRITDAKSDTQTALAAAATASAFEFAMHAPSITNTSNALAVFGAHASTKSISSVHALTDDARLPFSKTSTARVAQGRIATLAAIAHDPLGSAVSAYVQSGLSLYNAGAILGDAYLRAINASGDAALASAASTRDAVSFIPQTSNALLDAYAHGVHAFTDAAPKVAGTAILAVYDLGDHTNTAASAAPSRVRTAKDVVANGTVQIALALSGSIQNTEAMAFAPFIRGAKTVATIPRAAENTMLGIAGYTASLIDGPQPAPAAIATAAPASTQSASAISFVSFLPDAWLHGLANAFHSAGMLTQTLISSGFHSLATLVPGGAVMTPTLTVIPLGPSETLALPVPAGSLTHTLGLSHTNATTTTSSSAGGTSIKQIINNYYPQTFFGGAMEEAVLAIVRPYVQKSIDAAVVSNRSSSGGGTTVITSSGVSSDGATLTNVNIQSGNATVSSLTTNSLTAGSSTLATTTVNGDLTVTGTLHATIAIATSSFSGPGSNLNADFLDGLDSTYFLANSFSSSSAAYYLSQNPVSGGTGFSTTSADFWKTQRDFFSTTSANAFLTTKTTDDLLQGATNKYYSDTLARAAFSSTASGLTYTSGTGVFSLTAGYTIPLTASTTEWSSAYQNRITSANAPLSITGNAISISQANASTNGYISSTDWNTFNSKISSTSLSSTATGLAYNSTTGVFSLTAGYTIPTTASTSAWETFYQTPSSRITAGTNLSWVGNTLNGPADSYIRGLFSAVSPLSYNSGTGAFTFSTSSISGSGSNFNADLLDGLDSSYLLANSFSTSSADFWKTQRNFYSTTSADYWLTGKTTDTLAQGSTNKYYDNALVNTFVAASTTITKAYTSNVFTNSNAFNGGLSIGTLNGPLQANNGVVSATSTIGVLYGGTGLSSIPAYGQILVGNGTGYTLTATSSLGLESALTFTSPLSRTGTVVSLLQASNVQNGYLSSIDWNTFNNKISSTSLSSSATGLTYTSGTGVFSLTAGYTIPLTASTTDWNTAYVNRITSASAPLSISSNAISISQANTSTNGYLSSTDWNTFNGKQAALSFTYPLVNTANTISLAFGTTTSNTWGGTQTFTNAPVLGSLTGFLKATAGVLSTSLIDLSTDVTSTLPQSNGGTGITTYSPGDILYANSGGFLTKLPVSSNGLVLKIQAGLPSWGVDQTIGGGGSDGIFATSSGKIYPLDTANTVIVGSNSTSTANSIFEVNGEAYVSTRFAVGTTSPSALATLDVGGNALVNGTGTFNQLINLGLTANTLTYANGSKQLSSVTLGTGLSLTGGSLSVSTTSISGSGSNFNADLLNGQHGAYYLDRANHTGTQLAATISDFSSTARGLLTSTATGLTYTSGTGVFSLTAGYTIPLTASTTDWNTAYVNRITSANAPLSISSNAISISQANTSTNGYLSSTDWNTFNGKVSSTSLSALYPLAYNSSTGVFSTAFSTTTTNTYSALNTFNGGITTAGTVTLGSLTGVLHASSGVVSASNVLLGSEVSGTLSVANGGTGSTTLTGILKGNGTGGVLTAVSGTDYAPATSGSSLLYGNGAGGFSNASVSSPLTFSAGALGIQVANTSQSGYLTSTDWNTFNGKQAALSFTYPLVNTANTISVAFGTTTSNTWGGTQTFTNAPVLGSLTGILRATSGVLSTGAINLASGDVSGTLSVSNGGTGSTTLTGILGGNGTSAVKTIVVGSGLTFDGTTLATNGTGITSLGPVGQLQTGSAQTLASTTSTYNGLTSGIIITAAGNTQTFQPVLSGVLTSAGGGTGISSPSAAGVLLGNYAGTGYMQVATSSLGLLTTNVAEGSNLYFTNARADARINATSTIGTLTSAPNLGTVSTTLSGILKATSGVLSAAVSGTDYAPATSGSSLLYGNGAGGFSNASVSSPLTFSAGALGIQVATGAQNGYLSLTDWNTFNGKVSSTSLSALYPLAYNSSTGVFSTAFSTTTTNTYSALNTFNGGVTASALSVGTLSGVLYGNTGTVTSVATSSLGISGAFSYSGTLGGLVGGANGTLSLATNGVALTNLAQIAANTILGNPTGSIGNVQAISTSSLGIALSDTTGTLVIARGGTNNTSFTSNGVVYYDGTKFATNSGLAYNGTSLTLTGSGAIVSPQFYAADSSSAPGYSWALDAQTGMYHAGSNLIGFATGGIGRVYIDGNGFLGIGTTTASAALSVEGNALVNGTGTFSQLIDSGLTGNTLTYANGSKQLASITLGTGLSLSSGTLTIATSTLGVGTISTSTALVNGQVAFSTGVNTIGNDSAFVWDNTLKRLGLGQAGVTPSAILDVHSSTSSVATIQANNTGAQGFSGGAIYQLLSDPGAAILSSSRLGTLRFAGATDALSTFFSGASIEAYATDNWSSTNSGTKLTFSVTPNGSQARAAALTIDQNGYVGIGTTSPGSLLSVQGNGLFNGNIATAGLTATGTVNFSGLTASRLVATDASKNLTSTITLANLVSSISDVTGSTGTGNLVLSASPTLTGTATVGNLIDSGLTANSFIYANASSQLATGSVSAPLTFSAGTLSISQSNTSTNGYLSSTDWNTFNGKQAALTGTTGQFPYFSGTNTVTATSSLFLAANGNVGIGTTSPATSLSVVGTFSLNGSDRSNGATIAGIAGTASIGGSLTIANSDYSAANGTGTGLRIIPGAVSGVTYYQLVATANGFNTSTNLMLGGANTASYIGLGTATPGAKLDVFAASASDNAFRVSNNSGSAYLYGYSTAGTSASIGANGSLPLLINATGGNVGIGTTSPYAKLSVSGDLALTGGIYDNNATRGTNGQVLQTTGTGVQWVATSSLGFATLGSFSASAPLSYNSGTGAFSISQSNTSTNGYLSSTDWNTFNGKQAALTGTTGQFGYFSGTNTFTATSSLFLAASGNVGIGSTSPYARLSITGAGTTSGINFQTTNSALTPLLTILDNGNIGIGSSTPSEKLAFTGGNIMQTVTTPATVKGTLSNSVLAGAVNTYVSGKYAYVTASSNFGIAIVDISNPASPTLVSSLQDVTNLNGAFGIAVSGRYAFITANGSNKVTVVDISNPKTPFIVSTLNDATYLASPRGIVISGKYAYVGATGNNRVTILDISNPYALTVVGSVQDATYLFGADGVFLNGKYLYVAAKDSNLISIVDVSNPAAPFIVGHTTNDLTHTSNVHDVYVVGKYLYTAAQNSNSLAIFDVSDPTTPTLVGSLNDSTNLNGTKHIVVAGRYAYMTANGNNRFTTVDVSDPAAPFVAGSIQNVTTLSQARGIFLLGKYAAVAINNGLTIMNIDGIDSPAGTFGNVNVQTLVTNFDAQVGGDIFAKGSLNIGGSLKADNGLSVLGSGITSATFAADFRNASGTSLFNIRDDGNIGLGTTTPYARLSLGGGDLVLGAATAGGTPGDLFLPKLGTAAGSFLAVDANGKVIATTTPASSSLTGTTGQLGYFSATNTFTATSSLSLSVGGNVGVGTVSPASKLDVAGFINTDAASGYKQDGNLILYASSTLSSIAAGYQALNGSTGLQNAALGYQAGNGASGNSGTYFGYQAGGHNPSTSSGNTFIGSQAGYNITQSSNNIAIGNQALQGNATDGGSNGSNVAIGYQAIQNRTSGYFNSAIGTQSLQKLTSGAGNVGIGYLSGNAVTTSNHTVAIGYSALPVSTGNSNIAIGSNTATSLTSGNNNIIIGTSGQFASNTASNQLNIQNIIWGTGNSATGTTTSTGNIGIGTSTPTAQLSTTGTVRFSNFGAGQVSTDALGNLTVSSDERLKNINGSFTRGLADIEKLSPILYHWNAISGLDRSTQYAGFSAQNTQIAIPEAVTTDPRGYLALQDRPILAASVNAIKELAGRTDALATTSVSFVSQLQTLSSAFAQSQANLSLPHALTATTLTAESLTIAQGISSGSLTAQSVTASGTVSAARYTVPAEANVFTFGSSTMSTVLPQEALTDAGTVDIFKLASYGVARVQALAERTDLLSVKIDDIETRLAAVEALTGSSSTSPASVIGTTLSNVLASLGVVIKDGIAMFSNLVTHQLTLIGGTDGTSSTGSITIPTGSVSIAVSNPLVHTSSKIFLTFTSSVDGSWYLSEKKEGSFTVMLSKAQTSNTTFDYFLLQTDPNAQIAAVGQINQVSTPPPGSSEATTTPPNVSQDGGPVVSLKGAAATQIAQGGAWTDPGATAVAADGTDLTANIVVKGAVDVQTPGLYTITYSATDAAGKVGQTSRVVTVLAPTTGPSDTTVTSAPADSTSSTASAAPVPAPVSSAPVTTATPPASATPAPSDTTVTSAPADSTSSTASAAPVPAPVSSAPDPTPTS